jgi:hypothetical protein
MPTASPFFLPAKSSPELITLVRDVNHRHLGKASLIFAKLRNYMWWLRVSRSRTDAHFFEEFFAV